MAYGARVARVGAVTEECRTVLCAGSLMLTWIWAAAIGNEATPVYNFVGTTLGVKFGPDYLLCVHADLSHAALEAEPLWTAAANVENLFEVKLVGEV